jgi:hypothetical protein
LFVREAEGRLLGKGDQRPKMLSQHLEHFEARHRFELVPSEHGLQGYARFFRRNQLAKTTGDSSMVSQVLPEL